MNFLFVLFVTFLSVLVQDTPKLIVLDKTLLEHNKSQLTNGDKLLHNLLKKHVKRAESILRSNYSYSVVNNNNGITKARRNEYFSLAPYWWPSGSNNNRYIQKDGKINPERYEVGDYQELLDFCDAVSVLSLSYYYTNDERYAKKAISLIEKWFILEDTRMLPSFNFGQVRYGVAGNTGGSAATSDSYPLVQLVDHFVLLKRSNHWNIRLEHSLDTWYGDLLKWFKTSRIGEMASAKNNNIATYYDIQVLLISTYLGDTEFAKQYIENVASKRINQQIGDGGKQFQELARKNSWNYSVMNLNGLMIIADIADYLGMSLLTPSTDLGRRLDSAYSWMLPYFLGKKWPYSNLTEVNRNLFNRVYYRGAKRGLTNSTGRQRLQSIRLY